MRGPRETVVIPRGRSGYSLRIPGVFVDPPYDRDHPDFVSPARARLIGFEMRQERARSAEEATWVAPPATEVAEPSTVVTQPGLPPEQPRLTDGHPCRVCGATPAKGYLNGWFCAVHGPTSPPHTPDPYWGAKAMRERYERSVHREPS